MIKKVFQKGWERSNRLSLMFMGTTITTNLKITLPKTDNTMEFMKFMQKSGPRLLISHLLIH